MSENILPKAWWVIRILSVLLFVSLISAFLFLPKYLANAQMERLEKVRHIELPQVVSLYTQQKLNLTQEKPLVIVVFSSWCKNCIMLHKEILKLRAQRSDLLIYGLALDKDPVQLRKWLQEHNNPFDDVAIVSAKQAYYMGCSNIPVMLLVDGPAKARHFQSIDRLLKYLP